MDTRDASSHPDTHAQTPASEDLSIDWSDSDVFDEDAPASDALALDDALSLPDDLFDTDAHSGPEPGEVTFAAPVDGEEPGESPFVLDDLFPGTTELADDGTEDGLAPAADLLVQDVVATNISPPAMPRPAPKPRLAPERKAPPRRPNIDLRKLWIPAAVVAVVVALSMVVIQRRDSPVNVRSAAPAPPSPTVRPSITLAPTTTPTTTATTSATSSTSTPSGAPATTGVATTSAPVTTAAPRPTVGSATVTTQARPPADEPVTPTPTTTPTTVPATVVDPPSSDTTATTRRPRETIPPTTAAPTTTTVAPAPGDEDE